MSVSSNLTRTCASCHEPIETRPLHPLTDDYYAVADKHSLLFFGCRTRLVLTSRILSALCLVLMPKPLGSQKAPKPSDLIQLILRSNEWEDEAQLPRNVFHSMDCDVEHPCASCKVYATMYSVESSTPN